LILEALQKDDDVVHRGPLGSVGDEAPFGKSLEVGRNARFVQLALHIRVKLREATAPLACVTGMPHVSRARQKSRQRVPRLA
jgi:hypothetical protein